MAGFFYDRDDERRVFVTQENLKAAIAASSSLSTRSSGTLLAGSTKRLTLTGCRCCLDRVQHAMPRDRVVERRAQMRSLSIIPSETRVRLGDVGGRALRRRPPILLSHGQHFERGLAALAAAYGHLEDLGLAAGGGLLQVDLGAVDLPEEVCAG